MALPFLKTIRDFLTHRSDEVCVVSTIGALMEGVYGGVISCAELRKHGDFGLGTFDSLDGEMIAFNGNVYKATPDGKVATAGDTERIAYAVIKHFHNDKTFDVNHVPSLTELGLRISRNVGQTNAMLAAKVSGKFQMILLRAVPKQQKPFPSLAEVAKEQREFELHNERGTLVGFRFPQYTGELSVAGFHFHFISDDRRAGGHVLDIQMEHGQVECDFSRELNALLPDSSAFDGAQLDCDHLASIRQAES